MYLADGDCNAIVSIDHASSLLVKDEITVGSGLQDLQVASIRTTTCGKLVKAGSPLNKPFAATILPNGNMVVANTGKQHARRTDAERQGVGYEGRRQEQDAGDMGPLCDRLERRQYGYLLHRYE